MRRASRRTLAGAAAGAFLSLGSAAAHAESENVGRTLAEARAAVADLRLDAALALVAPLRASPDPRTRVDALAVSAVARLLSGDTTNGAADVASLYAIAPAYALEDPSLPPRVTRAFEAEAAKPHERAITLAVRPDESDAGAFRISTSLRADRIALACRTSSGPAYQAVASVADASGAFRFQLPTLRPYDCYAAALDADGLPLGALGTREAPFPLSPHVLLAPIGAVHGESLASKWWFWSSIGAVVVAAAVTTVVVLESRSQSSPPPADITVPAHGASVSW
jgi:hypothetical protein